MYITVKFQTSLSASTMKRGLGLGNSEGQRRESRAEERGRGLGKRATKAALIARELKKGYENKYRINVSGL